MKIKNTFKRIIALAVSLLIVISAASGAIYTFAAVSSSDYTVDTSSVTNSAVNAMGESLVSSVEITNTLDGGATFTTQTTTYPELTDGNVESQAQIKNHSVTDDGKLYKGYFHDYITKDENNQNVSTQVSSLKKKYTDGTERKVRITLTLKGNSNISNILLAHPGSGTAASKLALADYAVFAAGNKSELYDQSKASFYHRYDNATEQKKYQNYKFNQDKLTDVRYVGIEIYNPHIDWADSYITSSGVIIFFPRVNEFNVYGSVVPDAVNYDNNGLLSGAEKGELQLLSSSITAKSYRNGVLHGSGLDCSKLIDEDLSTDVEFMKPSELWSFYDIGGVKYTANGEDLDVTINLTIALKPNSVIRKIVFLNSSNTLANRAKKYEVYAADSEQELYESKNRIQYIENTSLLKRQVINITNADGLSAKYVGFRIIEPIDPETFTLFNQSGGYAVPRIDQLGVYGDIKDTNDDEEEEDDGSNTNPNITLHKDSTTIELPEGESVVKSMYAKYKSPTETTAKEVNIKYDTATPPTYPELEGLTTANPGEKGVKAGGSFAKAEGDSFVIYRDGTTAYTDITYALDGKSEISDIFVAEHSNNRWKLAYKLYVSDDEATLFETEPMYVYKSTKATRFQHYKLTETTAKFVGLRITAATNTDNVAEFSELTASNIYPRLYGFGVIGVRDPNNREPQEGASLPFPTAESAVEEVSAYYFNGTERKSVSMLKAENLYNNTLSGETMGNIANAPFAYDDNGITKYYTDRYMDVVLNLQGRTELSDVYIAHHKSLDLMTREYSLYIGEDKNTLFDGEPYFVCDNSDLKQVQHYTFRGQTARYVGIRITKPHGTSGAASDRLNCYVRLLEFNAYGKVVLTPDDYWKFQKVTTLPTNKLPLGLSFDGLKYLNHKDNDIVYKSMWGDTNSGTSQGGNMLNAVNMQDGDYETQSMSTVRFASYDKNTKKVTDYTKNRVRYQTIWYDLKSAADLSFINLAFPATDMWTAGDYEVYIGNDVKTLFDGEPYATVDNYTPYKEQGKGARMNVIAFDKTDDVPDVARYVGIKVYNPICAEVGDGQYTKVHEGQNNIHVRLQEFQIYGKYVDESFDPTVDNSMVKTTQKFGDLSKLPEVYGPNLIKAKNATPKMDGGKAVSNSHASKLKEVLSREGGDLDASHIDFNDITDGIEYIIYVRLDEWELTQVNGFVFQGIKNHESEPYFASDYELYVVDEKEDIFTSEPVFHYNFEDYAPSSGQIIEFPKGQEPQGNWLVFKLNNPVYTAEEYPFMRLSLLYAWGEEAVVRAVPANLAENMPCDISFLNGSKRTEVSESNLTPKELGNITDSETIIAADGTKTYKTKLNTYGTIDTKGSKRNTLEMVYNLCGNAMVDSIMVSALINNTTGFKTMKVYASTLLQGVYDEDSLIWNYKVNSTGTINPTIEFKKSKEMRYIRFVFEGTKDSVRLNTIDVIGLDNQKMKTRNLTAALTRDNLTVEKIDLKTDNRTPYANIYPTRLDNAINGIDADFLSFEDGEVGKVGYSLTIDLCDLKTISKIELMFNYGFRDYWAKKINVYIVENKEQLAETRDPDFTVKPQKISGTVKEFVMRPRMARYVKVDFVEFSKIESMKTHLGTYKISSAIADIKVTGTKVKGMQSDVSDERLISFVDKKTKAEVSLIKLDENDIFTNVVGVRLTPETATNRQMDSLMINKLKIANKTIYKVDLLDLYGNVVEDLGGREVRVSFPVSKDERNGKAFVGDASDPAQIIVLEGCPETTDVLDDASLGYVCSCIDILKNKKYNYVCGDFEIKEGKDIKVALLKLTTINDKYWSEIGELEDIEVPEEEEYRDESWYDSIHTTDGRFVVTPVYDIFESGLRFTATDVTATKSYNDCYNVLDVAYAEDASAMDLQVAVFYDMRLSRNGTNVELADGAFADIAYTVPEFIYNNYTDLRAFYIDDTGMVTSLWSEEFDGAMTFQVEKMGKVAIVGTKLNGTDSGIIAGSSPETGESRAATTAVISLMVAAAFVVTVTAKRNKAENK